MSNHWTKEQEEALDARGQNLLLSAAAGSGKTAVLTERIIRLVENPKSHTDINELLVLTFTKAAASEMKARVSKALSDALKRRTKPMTSPVSTIWKSRSPSWEAPRFPRWTPISSPLSASISTSWTWTRKCGSCPTRMRNSFWKKRCCRRSWKSGMPREIRILDTVDLFADRYQDRILKQMVAKIYHFSCSLPFPEDWLSHLPDRYRIPEGASMDDLPWDRPVLDHLISLSRKSLTATGRCLPSWTGIKRQRRCMASNSAMNTPSFPWSLPQRPGKTGSTSPPFHLPE